MPRRSPAPSDEARTYLAQIGARGGTTAAKRMTAAERKARASKGGHAKAAKAKKKAL
jgi:hypothetical protein